MASDDPEFEEKAAQMDRLPLAPRSSFASYIKRRSSVADSLGEEVELVVQLVCIT